MAKLHLFSSLFAFFFLLLSLYGKADFRKGFIVTNQNDTIYGEIDYRSDNNLYKECIYRNKNNSTIYLPKDIYAYGFINDRSFISGILEDQFVEVLVNGELKCYKHNFTYYIQKNKGEIYILEKSENIIKVGDEKFIKRDDRWKRILYLLVYDCLKDSKILKELNYSERSITNTVLDYNRCKGSNYFSYKENRPWMKINIGIGLGLAVSHLTVTNNNHIFFEDNYLSFDPYFGIIFNIASPRIFDRLTFQTEVNYLKSDFFSSVFRKSNAVESYLDTYIYFHSLSIPTFAKYRINDNSLAFSVQGGLDLNFLFNSGSNVIQESIVNNVVNTYEYNAFEIEDNQVGVIGGIEVQKEVKSLKFGINIMYNHFFNLNSIENPRIKYDLFSLSFILYRK